MSHSHDTAWFFRRDEFDLLEEAYDGIFAAHDAQSDAERHRLEEEVLEEQMREEERMEARLAKEAGSAWESGQGCNHGSLIDDARHAKELLKNPQAADPLYRRSLAWARDAFRFGARVHAQAPSRAAFRVHVNAYLVPIKLLFARTEEAHEDAQGIVIAQAEYELAGIYLSRVSESLAALAREGHAQASALLLEARALDSALKTLRSRLAERRKYRGV